MRAPDPETGLPAPIMRRSLTRDGWLLLLARLVRMFAYGLLSIVLVVYLHEAGLDGDQVGTLIALTLVGDTVLSLWMTTQADRYGRGKTLVIGGLLMMAAGLAFATTTDPFWLLLSAMIGIISPGATEVGPFQSIEQAALSGLVPAAERTRVFAWYQLIGFVAVALGALAGGWSVSLARESGLSGADAYRYVLWGYALCGGVMTGLFLCLKQQIEPPRPSEDQPASVRPWLGLHRSRSRMVRLSLLFAVDAFGGGFILQSLMAYWLHLRYGADVVQLGTIFLLANLLSGLSAMLAPALVRRFGLLNTMVFAHVPSNLLLLLVPFMPDLNSAVTLLLIRFAISQVDLPSRQAYTMGLVAPDERAAAAGLTSVARSVGGIASSSLAAALFDRPGWTALPFLLAGGIKILYDVLLYQVLKDVPLVEDDQLANVASAPPVQNSQV